MPDHNKLFWNRFAKPYSPFMEHGGGNLYDEICAGIALRLEKDMRVLELACGSGQLSFRLFQNAERWEATDFSERMISEANKRKSSDSLRLSIHDATALPFGDAFFDAVVIANALHVMPEPEKALSEIRRVLKAGGTLYAPTFIHGEGPGFRLCSQLLELVGFRVYSKWSRESFSSFVASHGFEATRTDRLGGSIAPLCCMEALRCP